MARQMRVVNRTTSVRSKLQECQATGLIDRYILYPDHIIIYQGRYRHRIPARFIDAFVTGMFTYANTVSERGQQSVAA